MKLEGSGGVEKIEGSGECEVEGAGEVSGWKSVKIDQEGEVKEGAEGSFCLGYQVINNKVLGVSSFLNIKEQQEEEEDDEANLGDQEDASKQERKILDIDADKDITLDSTHFDIDPDMFRVHDLHGNEVFVETQEPVVNAATATSTIPVSAATAATIIRKNTLQALRAQEKRNKLPTNAQKKSTMSTYLKHMAGYKQSQLKNKSFAEIQKLFDKAMTRVNMFVDMDTELVKESSKKEPNSDMAKKAF
ncbi:hypothetical protein Tco_1145134 [Tanacetum coccineum]